MWVVVCWHDINHTFIGMSQWKTWLFTVSQLPTLHLGKYWKWSISSKWCLDNKCLFNGDWWIEWQIYERDIVGTDIIVGALTPAGSTWIQEAAWWLRCFPSRDLPRSQTLVVGKGMMPGWKLLDGMGGREQPTSRWRCQGDGGGLQRGVGLVTAEWQQSKRAVWNFGS